MSNLPTTMTVRELAEYLQVSERTIDREIQRGKIKVLRVGAQRRIKREWVQEYEANCMATTCMAAK